MPQTNVSENTQGIAVPVSPVKAESGAQAAPSEPGARSGAQTAASKADMHSEAGAGAQASSATPERSPAADAGSSQEVQRQTREDNAAFAAMRRQMEAAQAKARELEESSGSYKKVLAALEEQGIKGNADEIRDALVAKARNISPAQVKAERLAQEERFRQALKTDPEYLKAQNDARRYRDMVVSEMMKKDLDAIKAVHPDAKISSMEELDSDFGALISNGWSAVDAYEAIQLRQSKIQKNAPPSTGTVKSNESATDKEYFTSAELDRLTSRDLDNPKIFGKAMKSIARLRK